MTTATSDAIDLAELDLGDCGDYPDEGGFWSITRAEDLAAVTRDIETVSSERAGSS